MYCQINNNNKKSLDINGLCELGTTLQEEITTI